MRRAGGGPRIHEGRLASVADDGPLEIEGLSVAYGTRPALSGIDLLVPAGQLLCVLGPSGSGKSTLLRAVAGLEPPAAGRVVHAGRDLAGVPPHERGFGLMFQDYALFPHRDVAGNVGFGLAVTGWDRERTERRVAEMLELVGLPGSGSRRVAELSGGEQQRVALARALAPGPRLLMLDEPMGSLDRSLRERLPAELRAIFGELGVTIIYVTHDQEEALAVADRVVLLDAGRLAADGTPEALWTRPPSAWVAGFLGFRNVARATLSGERLETPWGVLPRLGQAAGAAPGPVTVVLRPDGLVPGPGGPVRGVVAARRFRGDHALLEVVTQGPSGDGQADMSAAPRLEVEARWEPLPAIGDPIALDVEPRAIVIIPDPAG